MKGNRVKKIFGQKILMENILLIHPSRKVLNKKDNLFTNESLVPSIGLASIAAFCRAKGIKSDIIDLRIGSDSIETIFDKIKKNSPQMVCITAFTTEITMANVIAGMIKKEFSELPVIVGGPHSSVIPKETMEEFDNFDIAVIGEGEEAVVELLSHFTERKNTEPTSIPGIAYRKNGSVLVTAPRKPIEDLNTLPFPAWDLFNLKYYNNVLPISASRGCPYRCYFCTPNYLGNKVRTKNHKVIVEEINWLVKNFGVARIQFADAMLGLLQNETILMCDEIIKLGLNKKIKWDCETRADNVNPLLLEKMKDAGCEWIALGVESGNGQILKEIVRKGETKKEIQIAVKMAKKTGIKVRCFFILGHCTETVGTIKETIDFAMKLNPDALAFGLMVPNPGSELRKLAKQKTGGLRLIHNRWEDYQQFNYSCLELENLSVNELKKWQAIAYFTFYLHHPLKALGLFFSSSAYNYNLNAIKKIPLMLLKNMLKKQ